MSVSFPFSAFSSCDLHPFIYPGRYVKHSLSSRSNLHKILFSVPSPFLFSPHFFQRFLPPFFFILSIFSLFLCDSFSIDFPSFLTFRCEWPRNSLCGRQLGGGCMQRGREKNPQEFWAVFSCHFGLYPAQTLLCICEAFL